MLVSIVVPVWNGQDTLTACLDSVYEHRGSHDLEVICVENASTDRSPDILAGRFPQARVLPQPVNLGFAGAVNEGCRMASGDVFLLLNQDCVVKPFWLPSILQTLDVPNCGIAGCVIESPDGSIDHAGAYVERPGARGVHLRDVPSSDGPIRVDYVTGAVFAFARNTWSNVGEFDDGYYPAYYEESDYCYRARAHGIHTLVAPVAGAIHFHTSSAWKTDPTEHAVDQHRSRYRFVSKHFDIDELPDFFCAELNSLQDEGYLSHVLGRFVAARDALRAVPDVLRRRCDELDACPSAVRRRDLLVGFAGVSRAAYARAKDLAPDVLTGAGFDVEQQTAALLRKQSEAYEVLRHIYFRDPRDTTPESTIHRLVRGFVLRAFSILAGREYLLRSTLDAIHVARMDRMQDALESLIQYTTDQSVAQSRVLAVLDSLLEYEHS